MIDFGGDAPGAYLPVAVVQLHFTSPQSQLLFGSAASDKNALCAHWLTEADDALNSEWVSHGAIWNNPPYSNIRPWVEKLLSSAYNSDRR